MKRSKRTFSVRAPALFICLALLFSVEAQASCGQLFAVTKKIDIVLDLDGLLGFGPEENAPSARIIDLSQGQGAKYDGTYRIPDGLEEFLLSTANLPGVRLSVLTAASSGWEQLSPGSETYVRLTKEKADMAIHFLRRVELSDSQTALDLFSDGEGGYRVYGNGTVTKDLRLIPGINLERAFLVDHVLSAPFHQGGLDQRRNFIGAADTASFFGRYPEWIPNTRRNHQRYRAEFLRARNDLARIRGLIGETLRIAEGDRVSPVEAWRRLREQIGSEEEGRQRVGLDSNALPGDLGLYWYREGARAFREVNPGFRLTGQIYEDS